MGVGRTIAEPGKAPKDPMRPRNPIAIVAALVAFAFTVPTVADAVSGRGCAAAGGNCSKRKLDGKHYMKMDLARSRWFKTSLFMASFRFTNLYDSSFRGANLRRADLSFGNRAWSDFRNADLTLSNLSRSDFYNSDFSGADLRSARLIGTKFDSSDFTDANFEGAKMKDSSFHRIKLCHTIQPDGTERNDNCPGNGGGNGNGNGGFDCCFPGGKKKDKDKGKDDKGTDGDESMVGELRALRP